MSVHGQAEGIEHGTMRGYRQHRYRTVEMCGPCRQADLFEQAARRGGTTRAARNAPMPPKYIRPYPPYLPGHQDAAWGEPIAGSELAVGDVLVFLGAHYPVDRIEPYTGELAGVLGEGARTAYSGTWDMAIGPDRTIRILPREGS